MVQFLKDDRRQTTGKNSMNMMMIILLCGNLFVIGFLSLINHRVLLWPDN